MHVAKHVRIHFGTVLNLTFIHVIMDCRSKKTLFAVCRAQHFFPTPKASKIKIYQTTSIRVNLLKMSSIRAEHFIVTADKIVVYMTM